MEADEMKSPFEAMKQTDEAGSEWWNSRQMAKAMGYTKYWNFERLMDKVAHAMQVERGLARNEHFREIEEMAQLGNGTARHVTSLLLSRAACMGIACNADQRKPMVKMAREYFQGALTGKDLAKGMEGNVLIYRSSTGKVNVSVLFNQETFWLSQQRMAELFGVTSADISYHLIQIENNGELHLSDCIKKILIPSEQWDEQGVTLYNLDAVIAVGYRVNSYEATQFRIWATKVLKEFIVKGFVLDDERLKGKSVFGEDYFEELLDRIREIRTSERRYYQKITDIYAECSYDYDKNSETTQLFYKTVQNMMHYAVTHQTAAEIVSKNYLSEKEMRSLELLSTAFVDIAELRAERQQLMSMKDWKEQLVKFLSINDHDILPDAGRISHEQAEEKALKEYDKYRIIQDQTFLSDFDKLLDELK